MITFITHLVALFAGVFLGVVLADNLTGDNDNE